MLLLSKSWYLLCAFFGHRTYDRVSRQMRPDVWDCGTKVGMATRQQTSLCCVRLIQTRVI